MNILATYAGAFTAQYLAMVLMVHKQLRTLDLRVHDHNNYNTQKRCGYTQKRWGLFIYINNLVQVQPGWYQGEGALCC